MSYLNALQKALAAEHAAVYVLGYLGAQTSQSAQPRFFSALGEAYTTHRARRDQLASRVRDAGGEPVAADATYELPDLSGDASGLEARALGLERSCAATYSFLVASSPSGDRRFAVGLLIDAAVRALGFGGEPERLPGR